MNSGGIGAEEAKRRLREKRMARKAGLPAERTRSLSPPGRARRGPIDRSKLEEEVRRHAGGKAYRGGAGLYRMTSGKFVARAASEGEEQMTSESESESESEGEHCR